MNRIHLYSDGPTACCPPPKVAASIRKELKQRRILSRGDVRLATAMGLVSTDSRRPMGMNDGVFYPPKALAASAAKMSKLRPSKMLQKVASKKTMHALALLVDFSDNKGKRPRSEFEDLIFDPSNPGSMTSYYAALSNGALNVTGEVIGYIRAPHPYSYYTNGESGMGEHSYPNNTPGLLVDVLTKFCKTDDLKRFDVDGDGFVDGIFLIHAGPGAEADVNKQRRKNKIWSHKWVLPEPFVNKGVSVYAYSTEPEDGRLGVFAHEFGHVLGLPDLYDTTYRSEGIGDWCLMAAGEWGGDGDQPTRLSAWCLKELGWVKPKNIKKTKTVTLKTLEADKAACHRVWKKGATGPEYFLLENRQATGQDSALPGSGLAVWHVDEKETNNDEPLHYLVALVQADGKRDLELAHNPGDAADVFPGSKKVKKVDGSTTPSLRANDGSATGVVLSSITASGGEISVKVKV